MGLYAYSLFLHDFQHYFVDWSDSTPGNGSSGLDLKLTRSTKFTHKVQAYEMDYICDEDRDVHNLSIA